MAVVDLNKLEEIHEPPVAGSTDAVDLDLSAYLREVEIDLRIEHLEGLRQDRREREKYADKIFNLVTRWLYGIMALIILCSLDRAVPCFHLSDTVILAIIGGTTVTVLGLFAIVAKYLFPKK